MKQIKTKEGWGRKGRLINSIEDIQTELSPGKKPICKQCLCYVFIDNGCGYCRKFPPQPVLVNRKRWIFYVKEYTWLYPIVGWCFWACNEFKPRKAKR